MFGTILSLAIFFGAALIGWALAEVKAKACTYEKNEEELAEDKRQAELLHNNGYSELGIKDVIRNISTKGFKAV